MKPRKLGMLPGSGWSEHPMVTVPRTSRSNDRARAAGTPRGASGAPAGGPQEIDNMIANYQIARVAEETVLSLKELESRIELLKGDLAALCTTVGHPEAARIAVTPARWLDPRIAQIEALRHSTLSPFASVSPYATLGHVSPFGVSPFGVSPFGVSPFGVSPFGVSPLSSTVSPVSGISPIANPLASPIATPFAFPAFQGIR